MSKKLLILENISKYYTSGQSVVMGLNNINLSFSRGEFVAVTGESGSGKSTLAKVLAGIHSYENGELSLNGKPTSHYDQFDWERYRCNCISFISQNYDILPGCTVLKNVVSALVLTGMDKLSANLQAEKILRQVELWDMKKRRAAKLSSGQKQRLSIARALAKPSPILIADEPTGNLDHENSAKVIELLASAAKERLVIMITHDFSEAESFATRHITIRDGIVASDVLLKSMSAKEEPWIEDTAQIQESPEVAPKDSEKPAKKKKVNLSLYTAKLQIASRPIWSTIMLIFFALTAFGMFAFLGTFVVNLDDSFTRIYDESAFYNGTDTLLVVMKSNKEELSQEDWDKLLNLNYVESLERYGYLNEVNYYYRENTDYVWHYDAAVNEWGHPTGEIIGSLTLNDVNLFMQTVPCLSEDEEFLKAGRLPENMSEVVAVGDEHLIGKQIPVYIQYQKTWAPGTYVLLHVTVVGVTDIGNHLYFDEQLGSTLTSHIMGSEYLFGVNYEFDFTEEELASGLLEEYFLGRTKTINPLEGRFFGSEKLKASIQLSIPREVLEEEEKTAEEKYYELPLTFVNYKDPANPIELLPGLTHDSTFRNYIEVAPDIFEYVVPDIYGNLVSLTITDYAYANRVLDSIHKLGYIAISPYQLGSTEQDPELAAERLQTLTICLLCFVAIFLLQILVLRAMFGMEIEEFRLLANLGLRCRTAKSSILWQILVFTMGGQLLAFIAVLLCSHVQIERIVHILQYLPASNVVLFMLIHLVTSLLTSLWIQAAISKQIYPFSLQRPDLKLDEEEEV